jgi:ABC-2 type transport system ATP-binding protein
VLVASHLLSELERTADHLLVLGRGRLLADVPMVDALAGTDGAQRLEDAYERLTAGATAHRGIVR